MLISISFNVESAEELAKLIAEITFDECQHMAALSVDDIIQLGSPKVESFRVE